MTLPEIVDSIKRHPSGGIVTDETRFDDNYLVSIVNAYRAKILREIYQKDNRIATISYQRHYPEYEIKLQDKSMCRVFFRCPQIISFDSHSDGLRYVGSLDCNNNFRRHQSRATLSNVIKNKFLNVNTGRFQSFLYNGSDMLLEIYGIPLVKEVLVEGVFLNPLDIPTYNKDKDHYPFNEDLLPILYEQIFKAVTSPEANTPTDLISDGDDATPQQLMRKQ